MTVPQLHREVADLVEKVEVLEAENEALKAELLIVKTQVPTEQKELLTTEEAANYIDHSIAFLNKDRMLATPRIPFLKESPRYVRYYRADLNRYNETRRAKKAGK
jgi:acetolactate synthase small subunit